MYKAICSVLTALVTFLTSLGFNVMPREKGNNIPVAYTEYGEVVENFEESFDFQKVNTLEINLESTPETTVAIEANGKKIYERTGGENYRFCAFKTVEADKLSVTVTPPAKVNDVTVSYKTSYNKDFRVTAYVCTDKIQNRSDIDEKYFDIITDVIMISGIWFNEKGEVTVDENMVETGLKNLRDAIGDRDINVYTTFLGPSADSGITDWEEQMNSLSEKYTKAFLNPKFIININKTVKKYGFDGIFFDYEYPIQQKYWNDFGAFLKRLDWSTTKKIGIAVSDWNLLIGGFGISSCDMLEFMQYDRFDANGNHGSFSLAPATVDKAREFFIDTKKVDLGVPFYARPADRGGIWLEYKDYADELGMSRDDLVAECGKVYFNSYQTVYDKTAYALSYGLGGMMIWHFTSDVPDSENPLSLFGAMGDCIDDRVINGSRTNGSIC